MSTRIDMSREAEARRQSEVDARLSRMTVTGEARTEARKNLVAEVEAEELAAATAAAAKFEATAERQRIASVYRAGRDLGRGVQAVRMALISPVSAGAMASILGSLPRDAEADKAALLMPGASAFGSPAARAERERIRQILALPDAAGRMGATAALALDGDDALTAAHIAPLLASLPLDATGPRVSPIGARAEGMAEFGGDAAPTMSKAEANAEGWKRAAATANASIGAGPKVTARDLAGASLTSDPHFGMTPEGRAAAEAALRARG